MPDSQNCTRPSRRFAAAACLSLVLGGLGACRGAAQPPVAPLPGPSTSAAAATPATRAAAAPTATATAAAPPTAVPPEAPVAPPPSAGSTKVTVKNDPAWAGCHRTYDAKMKDVSRDVDAMARGCAKVTKMTLVGKALTGKQGDQDPPQAFALTAEANHCYRVYAQSSDGIKDLDLAIKDSTGAIAAEDSTDDPSPVIVEDGAVCFKEADAATLVVSVGLGKGNYAVEIWKD
jgi:hypothetical protein